MIAQDKEAHEDILKQSIKHLKFLGYENIKADLDGYESPKSFIKKKNSLVITPDITAYKRTKKYFFELGLKSEKPKQLKTKWRLLDVVTRMKDHRFKIITTKGHYSFTNKILSDLNIEKSLIKL
ncbi:hypothetical protein [Olleya sp. UBA1516]|uniref:hypothetical protein n=1 Tax=Olleya sp. UBA1516 TaxID=1947013 RepID=UPI0025E56EEB|nr:hypothetical protein [Olleya sp. UBA1516]|tara:strand:- start:714 stop:1085 length:372 start_codon:yes stop_codon:yes gene_type:complete